MFLFLFLFISVLALLYTHFFFFFWIILFTNIVICAFLTVLSNNIINSIFFLIALFLNISIALFCINLVYLALILVIVYVGALSIFFLFTVMLLNVNMFFILQNKNKILSLFDFCFLLVLFFVFYDIITFFFDFSVLKNNKINLYGSYYSIHELSFSLIDFYSSFLFTLYGSIFVFLGFFLFIVMISVILLIQETFITNAAVSTSVLFRNYKISILYNK